MHAIAIVVLALLVLLPLTAGALGVRDEKELAGWRETSPPPVELPRIRARGQLGP